MKKRTKKIITVGVIALVFIILLFPFRTGLKDGGTIIYNAVLYRLTFWHATNDNYESGFYEATEFEIFPFNWINEH